MKGGGAVMRILGIVICLSYLALVTLLPQAPDEVPVRKKLHFFIIKLKFIAVYG